MKRLKLIAALAAFGVGFALLGAMSSLDSHLPAWWGMTIGGLFGLLMGTAFGGAKGRILDMFFGPEEVSGQQR
jgi:hydrogenase/urease accessory protein HupE